MLEELASSLERYRYLSGLWNEFEPGLISVKDVELETAKFAGVRIPELKNVIYEVKEFDLFRKPLWYSDGVRILKDLARLGIESEICSEKSLLGEEPHPGLLPQEDHPEGKPLREGADTWLSRGHPEDQEISGG